MAKPIFSAKHYDAIAAALYQVKTLKRIRRNKLFDYLTDWLANAFAADNPRFQRKRFLAVCEFGPFLADKLADAKAQEIKALQPKENIGLVQRTK